MFPNIIQENLKAVDMQPGALIKGTILDIKKDWIVVDTHLKTESVLPREQFKNTEIDVGDEVELMLETVENGYGRTQVSYAKARFLRRWFELEGIYKEKQTVRGLIKNKVRGGFSVDLDGVPAFLPGSLVDLGEYDDPSLLENSETDFKIVKIDRERLNMVVSHKAIYEEQSSAEKRVYFESLAEIGTVKGTVKRIMDYGAFIDLGKGEGLLHIGDIAWQRISHPSEVIKIGEQYEFKIINYDSHKNHLSLSLREMQENPWQDMENKFKPNDILTGAVTSVTDYGLFVEVAPNIEGLVHLSELDWVNKNPRPSNYAKVGDKVKVMILKVEKEKCRLSLGYKQCESNPWRDYEDEHAIGDIVEVSVKEIYDFGMFVEVAPGMDGFIHINNIDWDIPGEEAIKDYKKGQSIKAKITFINVEEEKISLSIKKTKPNHFEDFLSKNKPRKAKVKCTVSSIEKRRVIVNLNEHLQGIIPIYELTNDRLKEAADIVKVGDELEALVLNADKGKRTITLSIKEINKREEREALKKHEKKKSGFFGTLGDILNFRGTKEDSEETSESVKDTELSATEQAEQQQAEAAETNSEQQAEQQAEAAETDSEQQAEQQQATETDSEQQAEQQQATETDSEQQAEQQAEAAETDSEEQTEQQAEAAETDSEEQTEQQAEAAETDSEEQAEQQAEATKTDTEEQTEQQQTAETDSEEQTQASQADTEDQTNQQQASQSEIAPDKQDKS